MVKYYGERIIRSVCIVGGTHGNERLGVELCRQWQRDPSPVTRSSFTTRVVLGNPAAITANKRYVEVDLNRQFAGTPSASEKSSADLPLEARRARELDSELGPKGVYSKQPAVDFLIDLHSTNSPVGLVSMISDGQRDPHATRLTRQLQQTGFPQLKVTNYPKPKLESWSVDSITPYGLSFEVGPLPHGTLSSALLEATRKLVLASLDHIEARNLALIGAISAAGQAAAAAAISPASGPRVVTVEQAADLVRPKSFPPLDVYCPLASIPYPTLSAVPAVGSAASPPEESSSHSSAAGTSPVDSSPLLAAAKSLYTSGSSPPRLRSAVPPSPSASAATSPRAFCLASASDPSLVPRYAVLHPNVEYSCWQRIAPGDPAFLTADGKQTVVPFAYPPGSALPASPDKGAYILFSNEAAYQGNNIAFEVYEKATLPGL
jgi:aspartoacylase